MPCPRCGTESLPGQRFCANCGAALGPSTSLSEERRLVTVLFADVTGSTALGERHDPEDVRALLARFYALSKEVVIAHGGTLEKFIGDAVLAVFGLPTAHGDDADRAAAAALELRDRVKGDARLGERLPIRIGINTGEVVATRDPSAEDFLVTGDAVNTAARLQQNAEPWMILCGERTARAAASSFVFGPQIEIQAKGKGAAVVAYPLSARAGRSAARRLPLVGRDADLAHLELVAQRAFGERRPFLVSLIAPAGIGKTRLLEEFLDRLPSHTQGATVAIAQCLPYGQRLTYWPLRAVLFRLARATEDAPPEAIREGLRSWLRDAGIENPERTADLLAATVGLAETDGADRETLFAAWRTTVETAARRAPLILVFEDLHWSSDSLLDLVEFVIQPRGDSPVLMLALARPELLDRRSAWGGGRRNYVSLSLEPLNDGAVAEMVGHLLGRHAPALADLVVTRAEGNPFYAGEIVRSIMDRVPSLSDESAVRRAVETLPDTVQATVLARLDLLERNARRVLQLGSVFGRAFRTPGVVALAPEFESIVARLAEDLVEKDLVRPWGTDRFAFRHILIREVAYQTLPRAERARLHAAAGSWLENQAAGREDELAELIAFHYREAATLAGALHADGADGEAVRRKAAHWQARAGEVAIAAAATVEAERHFQAAIELAESDALPDLYERLGDVGLASPLALEAYNKSLELCRAAGRSADQELRVLAGILMFYMRFQGSVADRSPLEEINRLRAEGQTLLERVQDDRAVARFLVADAFLPFWLRAEGLEAMIGQAMPAAEASARRGLEIGERLDDARLRSAALDALAGCAVTRGRYDEVREYAGQRLSFQERLDLLERIDAHAMAAWASASRGDLDDAVGISTAGLEIVQPGQVPAPTLHLASWRIYALMLRGHWDEATAVAQRAEHLWIEANRHSAGFSLRGFLAALDIARARQDRSHIDRWRQVINDILIQFRPQRPTHRLQRSYVDLDLDALERRESVAEWSSRFLIDGAERLLSILADRWRSPGEDAVRSVLETASTYGYRILEGQTRRSLGIALNDTNELAKARDIFEQTSAVPLVGRARCELGLLTGDKSELTAGIAILESLGDVDQLDRVEQRQALRPPGE